MKNIKSKSILALICNALDLVLVTMAVSFFFTRDTLTLLGVEGTTCFRYFTIDSNILAALACLVQIPFNVKAIRSGRDELPVWAAKLKYTGTVVVTLTLLVVVCYLIPVQGVGLMTASSNLYLHIICPPLVIVSYLFFENGSNTKRDSLLGVLTVFVYAVVYLIMVVAIGVDAGGWPDFYNFNDNNTWPYFFAGIMVFTFLVSLLVVFLKNKINKKSN